MPKILLVFLFCFLLPIRSEAGIGERVFETTLPNGLKVILLENHRAPLVTFQVWYRVGSRNEEWGKTGLSHMLEHMMFKGTKKVGPEEFAKIIQENGGDSNAFTSSDFTAYFENLSTDRVQVAMDLEADRMQNLILRDEDFRTEKMVVMEERRMRTEDDPGSYLDEQMHATAFQVQPYHWPTIGWMRDIEHFTLDDLNNYYQTFYNPANAFLVVVGDFKKEDLLPKIEKAFGSHAKGTAPNREKDKESPQTGERRVYVKKEAQLPTIIMGYHAPNLRDQDGYVLEVIASILSGGKSSRLYEDLVRKKQLVLEADADNPLESHDSGLFSISAQGFPGKDIAEAEKALNEHIERLQDEPVGERELQKAKNQLESAFLFAQDSLFYQGMLLARNEISLSWKAIDDYIPSIRKVTPEDIKRVAKRYLKPDNRTVAILIPLPAKEGMAVPASPPLKERMVR